MEWRLLLSSSVADTAKRPVSTLPRIPDASVVAVNVAAALLVEELLALPSRAAASAAVALLWPDAPSLPARFLEAVGSGARLPVARLALSCPPLATALATLPLPVEAPARALADAAEGMERMRRHARAHARARYRELQAALLRGAGGNGSSSLLGYVYGTGGRPWSWAETTERLLDRVTALNRAMLRSTQPPDMLDEVSASLSPLAALDFARLALAIEPPAAKPDTVVSRHRALFAEMLGRAAVAS